MSKSNERTQSTPIYFKDTLKEVLKIACAKSKMSMNEFTCQAVQEKLEREREGD